LRRSGEDHGVRVRGRVAVRHLPDAGAAKPEQGVTIESVFPFYESAIESDDLFGYASVHTYVGM
jgi:hypothetical protein